MYSIRSRHGSGFDIISPNGVKIGTMNTKRHAEAALKGLNELYAKEMHRVS